MRECVVKIVTTICFCMPAQQGVCGACSFGRRGADLKRGTAHHSDWAPLEWALWSNAGPDIIAVVTPRLSPSREPAVFCNLALADEYVHVERFQQKRWCGRLSPERRRRRLFVAAVMDSCQRCVRAWLGRGPDQLCGSDTDSDGCMLNVRRPPGCVLMSWSSCGRLVRSVVVLRCPSRRCRLGRRLCAMRRARTASGRLLISGFVMRAGGKTCAALLTWRLRA